MGLFPRLVVVIPLPVAAALALSLGSGCGRITPEDPAPPLPDTALEAGERRNSLPRYPRRPTQLELQARGRNQPGPASKAAPAAQSPEERTAPARNLEQELNAAFGSGGGCMIPGSLNGGRARMSLSVVLSRTGRVTRATATAPVSREVSRCLREHAENIVLRGPVDGSPKTVTTQVTLTAPAVPGDDSPPDWELPQGAEAPAVVLPATGNDGLGRGYRPPDRTLPARGPDEMPEGFVPPGQTLPAQGPVPTMQDGITRY